MNQFNQDAVIKDLLKRNRAALARAAKYQRWGFRALAAVAIAACAAIFVRGDKAGYYIALLPIAFLGGWFYLSEACKKYRTHGERGRRLMMLVGGLGLQVPDHELLEYRSEIDFKPEELENAYKDNYYATKLAPGPERLGEMLEESAFWSSHMLSASANAMTWRAILVLVIGIAAPILLLPEAHIDSTKDAVKVFCAILPFLFATEFVGAVLGYRGAAAQTKAIVSRINAARQEKYPPERVMLIFADYNAAVESAPLFQPGVYEDREARLNKLWDEHVRTRPPL